MENMFYAAFADRLPEDWVPTPANCHDQWCGANAGSTDFSNFDSSINSRLISVAFDILRSELNFATYAGGAIPYKQSSLDTLWDYIVKYFIHTPHRIGDDDTIRYKHHGVPSGSMFTNLIDTIVSRIILTYLHRVEGCLAVVRTYGDDAHYNHCTCGMDTAETCAQREFGMRLKIERPNEHNCLTYCKAECHLGQPFHEGLWFRNIINCTSFPYEATECLIHMEPTQRQFNELQMELRKHKPRGPSRWIAMWKSKVQEFWPKFKHKWSTL